MDARVFVEPQQGATYSTLLAVAQATEEAGFEGFFRSDHYLKMGDVSGLPGPTDPWVTLGGLALQTQRISLGTLVAAATFRLPGPLAVAVAQVDQMSGGRVELGLGAGWFDEEHSAYGIPFPELGERFEILEEQLAIITGLWDTPSGQTFSHDGKHYTVSDSPALPKPTRRPPIIIGGTGRRRTPRLAATYATEFNAVFPDLGDFADGCARVRAACEDRDRDPDEMIFSAALTVCCGSDESEVAKRAAAIGRDVNELRENGLCGTPDEVTTKAATFAAAGADRMYLQILDLDDLDHIRLIGAEVLPAL